MFKNFVQFKQALNIKFVNLIDIYTKKMLVPYVQLQLFVRQLHNTMFYTGFLKKLLVQKYVIVY